MHRLGFLVAIWWGILGHTQGNLAICACFQNEAEWLPEWICYHKALGVDFFYLYNHASTDNWEEVLRPYVQAGWVTVVPLLSRFYVAGGQTGAYTAALTYLQPFEWVAFLDIDEFINLKRHDLSLKEWLAKFQNVGGVGISWQMFGTSGVERLLPGQLLIETLTRCAAPFFEENRHIKSIVRPSVALRSITPHHFSYRAPYHAVNAIGERVDGPFSRICIEEIQLNHYWTRTYEWFTRVKIPRRGSFGEGASAAWQRAAALQSHEDRSILWRGDAVRAWMQQVQGGLL